MLTPSKIQSAIDRYTQEGKRVLSVLDTVLTGKEYLVDNKYSYADLSFIPWNWILDIVDEWKNWRTEYPVVAAWADRIHERESVKEVKASIVKSE
jgi:glutathione S-transferase